MASLRRLSVSNSIAPLAQPSRGPCNHDAQQIRTEAAKKWRKIKRRVGVSVFCSPKGSCEQYGVERERKACTNKHLYKPYQIGEVGRSGEKAAAESEVWTEMARQGPEVCARSPWLLGFYARS